MSYILDALKRANIERERATVPGLHTQPLPTPAPTAAPSLRRWPALALAAGLLLSAVAAGLWLGRAPADDAPALAATVAPATAPAAVVLPVPMPAAPATTPATPTPPATPAVTVPAATVRTPAPAPPKVVRRPQVAKPDPNPIAVAVAKPAARAPTKTAIAPAAAASTARVSITLPPAPAVPPPLPLLSELSAELRRQIPPLAITGAVYSKNPGQRLLLVNNQVLKQGSLAAPELTLEEIGERSSVFSFRETRFRLAH